MPLEYHNVKDTDANRLFWSREAVLDGCFQWMEMWCKDCFCWQRVEHVGNERHCKVCSDKQHALMDKEYEAWTPPELSTKPLEWFPVICRCGRIGESTEPEHFRCGVCVALSQEKDEDLR